MHSAFISPIRTFCWLAGLLLCLFTFSGQSLAEQSLPQPQAEVVLEISGKISHTNAQNMARFDLAMLEGLPQVSIHTETPWSDGLTEFQGPLLRDLLRLVRSKGSQLTVVALNDYSVQIPVSDVNSYQVILALKKNGQHMRVREKGPLWIIYPWQERPELRSETYYGRSIWQLATIKVE